MKKPETGPFAGAFDADAKTEQALVAAFVSIVVHGLIAVMFIAAWFKLKSLEEEEARKHPVLPPPPPPMLVEAEALDEPTHDAPVADQVEKGKEELAQGEPAPIAKPVPEQAVAVPEVPKEIVAVPRKEKAAVRSMVAKMHSTEAYTDLDFKEVGGVDAGMAAAASSAVPGAPNGVAGTGDGVGAAGGVAVEHAPDLAARFTKELPRWAADVPGWKTATVGLSLETKIAIELDANGKVVVPTTPPPDKEDPTLADSVRRTLRALVTKLALPDLPVGAGTLRLSITATVEDRPEREDGDEIELAFQYDKKARTGKGTFTLKSGRSVTFSVSIVAVEPAAPPTDAATAPSASASAPAPSAPAAPP